VVQNVKEDKTSKLSTPVASTCLKDVKVVFSFDKDQVP